MTGLCVYIDKTLFYIKSISLVVHVWLTLSACYFDIEDIDS